MPTGILLQLSQFSVDLNIKICGVRWIQICFHKYLSTSSFVSQLSPAKHYKVKFKSIICRISGEMCENIIWKIMRPVPKSADFTLLPHLLRKN